MMEIAEQPLAHVTEAAALVGLRLRTTRQQPYGWELFTAHGDTVTRGSLDQLAVFLSGPRQ